MRRLGGVLLAVLTVFVAIGVVYTLRHHDAIPEAGETPLPTAPTTTRAPATSGSTSPTAAAARPVVAFLGDDWTLGVGASDRSKRATSLLSTKLKLRERNFGIDRAGFVAGGGYAKRVGDVVAARPSAVIVMGGRNDIVDNGSSDAAAVRQLFTTLRAKLPKAKIIAVAPMWGDSAAPKRLLTLRAAVKAAVTAVGGTYLDVADPIEGHPDYMATEGDPDDDGYRAVAAAIEPDLAPLVRDL